MTGPEICERLLSDGKERNVQLGILPSENAIADRMLARSVELKDAYDELWAKLGNPRSLNVALELFLSAAAFWNPEKLSQAGADRLQIEELNEQIAETADRLAALWNRRSSLNETSGFTSGTHYHICNVIEAASTRNYHFQYEVQKPLAVLRMRYDLKYWPTIEGILLELASNSADADVEATDSAMAAGTGASRASLADYFKVLMYSIEENSVRQYGVLPRDFKLTDRTLATLANCSLGLGPDELVDETYVKRFRQRERDLNKV